MRAQRQCSLTIIIIIFVIITIIIIIVTWPKPAYGRQGIVKGKDTDYIWGVLNVSLCTSAQLGSKLTWNNEKYKNQSNLYEYYQYSISDILKIFIMRAQRQCSPIITIIIKYFHINCKYCEYCHCV